MSKVLIVDKSIDRKKRIAALKGRGFSVFPALQLTEARSRCRTGAYDLIIVNGHDDLETAASFCEELRDKNPKQAVLLAVPGGADNSGREYMVADDPESLARSAATLLGHSSQGQEPGEQEDRATTPDRVSA